jgi:hypothetical protein
LKADRTKPRPQDGPYDRGQASLLAKFISTNGKVSYYPKPAANAFKMFAMMTGTRRAGDGDRAGRFEHKPGCLRGERYQLRSRRRLQLQSMIAKERDAQGLGRRSSGRDQREGR